MGAEATLHWQEDHRFEFTAPLSTAGTATHDVLVAGSGPPILILQELPGIGEDTLKLCARLNAAGFTVYLPHLLGKFGKTSNWNALRLMCVRREFNIFLKGRQSPIAAWMRSLVSEISAREHGAQVGVIGMCLTGCFALPLMAQDAVSAAVASQPALPIRAKGQLHMTPAEVDAARNAMQAKGPALAMRFVGDKLVPDDLWNALKTAFGDTLDAHEYPGDEHSLLTLHFHTEAYARVEAYFKARLGG